MGESSGRVGEWCLGHLAWVSFLEVVMVHSCRLIGGMLFGKEYCCTGVSWDEELRR